MIAGFKPVQIVMVVDISIVQRVMVQVQRTSKLLAHHVAAKAISQSHVQHAMPQAKSNKLIYARNVRVTIFD